MFILHDLLSPLQAEFSSTAQGQRRKIWFAYTLLAVVVPFTSSITSNLLRALQTLFGLNLCSQGFYTFMASSTLPWKGLWQAMWGMISSPAIGERIMVALDDCINTIIIWPPIRNFIAHSPDQIRVDLLGSGIIKFSSYSTHDLYICGHFDFF